MDDDDVRRVMQIYLAARRNAPTGREAPQS
jgi:hypothetical protein